jgi:hypothetical protein
MVIHWHFALMISKHKSFISFLCWYVRESWINRNGRVGFFSGNLRNETHTAEYFFQGSYFPLFFWYLQGELLLTYLRKYCRPGMVVHTYNPSCLEGWGRRIIGCLGKKAKKSWRHGSSGTMSVSLRSWVQSPVLSPTQTRWCYTIMTTVTCHHWVCCFVFRPDNNTGTPTLRSEAKAMCCSLVLSEYRDYLVVACEHVPISYLLRKSLQFKQAHISVVIFWEIAYVVKFHLKNFRNSHWC